MSANTPTPSLQDQLLTLCDKRGVRAYWAEFWAVVQAAMDLQIEHDKERMEQELAAAVAECARLKAELEKMREDAQQAGWDRDLAE